MELPCDLTPEQRALYDTAVEEWRILRVAVQQVSPMRAAAPDNRLVFGSINIDCSPLPRHWDCCIAGAGPPAVLQPRRVEDLLGHAAALLQAAVRQPEGTKFRINTFKSSPVLHVSPQVVELLRITSCGAAPLSAWCRYLRLLSM
jgi:hypothetical protein